jgi:hypothetical protein
VSTSEILRRDPQCKEAKREERNLGPPGKRLLRPKQIWQKLAVGKTKFWEDFVATGRIKLVDVGPNAKAAPEDEVDAVIDQIVAERDAKLLNTDNEKEERPEPAGARAAESVATRTSKPAHAKRRARIADA